MRKSLIVGLGGTGSEICTWLANRIIWEYGSLDSAPFVDFLAIDTSIDQIQGTALHNVNYFHHAVVSQNEIEAMRRNPQDYDEQMEFSKWYNPSVINTQGVTDGTQGVRMLGRIALLLPHNFNTIYARLDGKLRNLSALQVPDAQAAMADNFGRQAENLSFLPRVHVYVVATSCGGTGCGTWIDFGYILRRLQAAYAGSIASVGILTLPAINENDRRKKANAHALLTELNHFSSGHDKFEVKYPDLPTPRQFTEYPYDFPYLVTVDVTRVDRGGLQDFHALNSTIGQYIFSDIFYDRAAGIRDGRRDDVKQYFISPDGRGLSQRYMTFGISLMQYPVERIMRGCTYMLLAQAFSDWQADHKRMLPPDPVAALGLDEATLAQRLMMTPGGTIAERINRQLDEMADHYALPDDLNDIEDRLVQAVGAVPSHGSVDLRAPFPDLPVGYVAAVAGMNANKLASEYKQQLTQHLEQALFSINHGPSYCLALLEALRYGLQRRQQPAAQANNEDHPSGMRQARAVLQGINEDGLQQFPIPFKTITQQHWVETWKQEAKSYFNLSAARATREIQAAVCREVVTLVELLEKRIANFSLYAASGHNRFQEAWREQDKAFQINGLLLFEPGSLSSDQSIRASATITKEYREKLAQTYPNLAQAAAEAAVKSKVIADLRSIGFAGGGVTNDLLAAVGRSFFDGDQNQRSRYAVWRSDHDSLCIDVTQPYFVSIKDTNVIEAFANSVAEDQWQHELTNLFALSKWFLPLNENTPGFRPLERKHHYWTFLAGARERRPSPQLAAFKEKLLASAPERIDLEAMDHEPHTILFLSEYGAFPLRIIQGLGEWRAFAQEVMGLIDANNPMGSANGAIQAAEIPTVYTQENIPWISFEDTDQERRREMEELFLVGLALNEIKPIPQGFIFESDHLRRPSLRFHHKLPLATRTLYDANPLYPNVLKSLIMSRRSNGERDDEIIRKLFVDFLDGRYLTVGLQIPSESDDPEAQKRYIWRVFERFISRPGYEGLLSVYRSQYAPAQNYLFMYHTMGELMNPASPEGPRWPESGYYCPNDRVYFGEDLPEKCPGCGTVFFRFD